MAKRKYKALNPLYFLLLAASILIAVTLPHTNLFQKEITCANSISCIKDLSGKAEDSSVATFLNKPVKVPQNISQANETAVLGEKSNPNKRIYVDLSIQRLFAYEDNKLAFEFPVSTGKWGRTPTGDFKIWIKLRYTRMSGGNSALGTYYNLPNVPFTMFYANADVPRSAGYALHGAYWHDNFGHPMSHGCVNISIPNAEKLYYWANPVSTANTTYASAEDEGTLLTVYGTAPLE